MGAGDRTKEATVDRGPTVSAPVVAPAPVVALDPEWHHILQETLTVPEKKSKPKTALQRLGQTVVAHLRWQRPLLFLLRLQLRVSRSPRFQRPSRQLRGKLNHVNLWRRQKKCQRQRLDSVAEDVGAQTVALSHRHSCTVISR